ncbi:hypothetical protein ACHAXT_005828 [Thalassiosira profunda]
MASKSGRRGVLPPESKGAMESSTETDAMDVDSKKPAAAMKNSSKRRTSKSMTNVSVPDNEVPKELAAQNPNTSCNPGEEGCKVCHLDVDHANLLLCESCNDEYHTYCLNPPLESVPEGDFFCDKCKRIHAARDDDGLDSLVSALSPAYTSRFGEIVWAAGGQGFGWWPACIYDPRLTVGGARQLARKNLGKRHLIYFFECNEAPFTVLGDNKLTPWDDGFIEEYDLGKVAKSGGKNRFVHFERAKFAAQLEHGRPIDMRMDWNHQEEPKPQKVPKQKSSSSPTEPPPQKKKKTSPALKRGSSASSSPQNAVVNRGNLEAAVNALNNNRGGANAIEQMEDGTLVCKILRRLPANMQSTEKTEGIQFSENVGFVTLPSRQNATFTTIRRAVESDLDDDMLPSDEKGKRRGWKFYVPSLGPMSVKQEGKIGPALEFLTSTVPDDVHLGNGTPSNPLKVVIMDV